MDRGSATWISATRVWIPIAAALFTVALIVSAVVIPELRLLHALQAIIYVAIVILARSNSMWAIGAGLAIAVVWNGHGLFVSHSMQRGITVLWSLLQTGHMRELGPTPIVPMMVLLGGIAHFVLIGACLAVLFDRRIDDKKPWKMVAGAVSVLAYFALIIIVSDPR
jgi:hypothetical protein